MTLKKSSKRERIGPFSASVAPTRERVTASRFLIFSVLSIALAVFSFSCSKGSPPKGDSKGAPTPDTMLLFGGDTWLSWDKSARLAFIMGNLRGLWDGQDAGCGEAKLQVESLRGVTGLNPDVAEKLRFQCANKFKLPARPFDSYEQVITDFYNRYPGDRSIEIQDVLRLLVYDSQAKLTADDIHRRIKVIR